MEQRSFSVSVSGLRPGSRVAVSLIGLICPSCMSRYDFSTLTLLGYGQTVLTVQNGPGGGMRGHLVATVGPHLLDPGGSPPLTIDTILMQDNFPGRCRPLRRCMSIYCDDNQPSYLRYLRLAHEQMPGSVMRTD